MTARVDRILDPISRLSEIMFGLLMTLTFTGTMSVVIGTGGDVRSVLIAALGFNLAWGIVDGTMHVLATVTERGRELFRHRLIPHRRHLTPGASCAPVCPMVLERS
jgi:hypothetical protein